MAALHKTPDTPLSGIASGDRDEIKHLLKQIIEKIELKEEPSWPLEIHYGVPINLIN